MKSDKTIIQKLKEYWYVEPYKCNKDNYINERGEFNEKLFNQIQNSFNREAKWEQMTHRIVVVYCILSIPMIILISLSLFKIVICLGLFLGIVGMLLG